MYKDGAGGAVNFEILNSKESHVYIIWKTFQLFIQKWLDFQFRQFVLELRSFQCSFIDILNM